MGFHEDLKDKGIGAKDWINSFTEVEYLGDDKFGASIAGNRVFKDKSDNKWKKHKITDNIPDYVLVQSANCCVEVYPYYAKYYDVNHEDVRLYEERWVVQRLFKEPDDWRDVDAYNPIITVEEYPEPAGDVVKVTVTYDSDYGILTVEYFQRDGNALKHNVTFKNTSGSEETFRVLQRWAGIVGAKCNGKDVPVVEDAPYFAFHSADKTKKKFNISENLYSMVFNPDRTKKTDQCLQRPVSIDTHAQGMKADFIYAKWVLAQGEGMEIDPATLTITPPSDDALVDEWNESLKYGDEDYLDVQTCTEIPNYNRRSFLKFGLTLPDGATITLANLRGYCYVVSSLLGGVTDVEACRVADDSWVEADITWETQPGFGVVEDTKVPAVGWVEWDVTGFVQAEWAGDKVVSICLKSKVESYDDTCRWSSYRSKEHDGDDPELYVEYTPAPPPANPLIGKPLISPDIIKKAIIR